MRIIVDADACPELNSISNISNKYSLECHLFCDYSHILHIENTVLHYISSGFQMVDIAISNFIEEKDILITQDYGLACIAISKHAQAINPNGIIYTKNNIDELLKQKFIHQQLRKQHIKTKQPKKRTKEMNMNFLNNLEKLINFTKSS